MAEELRIAQPLRLPSGLTLRNRIAKAAMAEGLADKRCLPADALLRVYGRWAEGGFGMLLTGNIEVSTTYLGSPGDMSIPRPDEVPEEEVVAAYRSLAATAGRGGAAVVAQINHPGRQSYLGRRSWLSKSLAPSAVPANLGTGVAGWLLGRMLLGTPRAMTIPEIEEAVAQFARAARIMAAAGFAGVELHGAHGYLIAQFLSARTNLRTDAYGGSARNRARFAVEVIRAVRAAVPKGFAVGIKLNSVDHQSKAELADCIEQLRAITDEGVDFVEISGGSMEDPVMFMGPQSSENEKKQQQQQLQKSDRTKAREAFFLEFAEAIRSHVRGVVPLMLTGGNRTRNGMETALAEGTADIIGLGRPVCVDPIAPSTVLLNKPEVADADARLFHKKIQVPWLVKALGLTWIGAGVDTAWYLGKLQKMAKP